VTKVLDVVVSSVWEAIKEREMLKIEIERAKRELADAENRLNNADTDFIEAAVFELLAKQKKLNALLKRAKECA